MADTIPNIVVSPNTAVNIYADAGVVAAGITVGTKLNVAMISNGTGRLYSGALAPAAFDDDSGYRNIETKEEFTNDLNDAGAWIFSPAGCVINVKAV